MNILLQRLASGLVCLAFALGACVAVASEPDERPPLTDPDPEGLVSPEFRPRPVSSPVVYDLLRLPELITRLALTPTFPVVSWADDVALNKRVMDLLTNEEGTSLFLPTARAFGADAPGAGFRYRHSDLFGREERLVLSGSLSTNGDRDLGFEFGKPLIALDGQPIQLVVQHRLDNNERYWGFGPGDRGNPRALRVEETQVDASLSFFGVQSSLSPFTMTTRLGYRRRQESPGKDSILEPVAPDEPLPGFGAPHDYLELTQNLTHDLRDAEGRTTSGTLVQLDFDVARAIDGAPLSAAGAALRGTYFIHLAPLYRVLVLHAGTAAVTPWSASERVASQSLITLGSETFPRGYNRRRFRDRVAWWSAVEYRYPVLDLGLAGSGASATLFFDAGQISRSYPVVFQKSLRYSYGFGLRAETMSAMVFRAQLAFSPEGARFTLSLNEAYDRP